MAYINFDEKELEIEKTIKTKNDQKIIQQLIKGWKADVARIKEQVAQEVKLNTDNDLKNIDCEAKEDYIYYTKLFHILDDFEKKQGKKSSPKTR